MIDCVTNRACLRSIVKRIYTHATLTYELDNHHHAELHISTEQNEFPLPTVQAHLEEISFDDDCIPSMTVSSECDINDIYDATDLAKSVCTMAADILLKCAKSIDKHGVIDINDYRLEQVRPCTKQTFEQTIKLIQWEESLKNDLMEALFKQAIGFVDEFKRRMAWQA